MRKITATLFGLLLASCASTKLQNEAQPLGPLTKDNNVEVSSEIVGEFSDNHNILLQIGFENSGGQSMRIDSAQLDLPTADKAPYNIIVGKDLVTWSQGKALVPDEHLYTPFDLSSMSVMKRWILVNIPNGRIARNGKLILKTAEGETYTYKLKITE